MDEQSLNELLECSVCLERLDHTSKVLPCQHTFCRRCLDEIVSTKHELRCPECRNVVTTRVEDLPSNILLIRLLEGLKNVTVVGSSTGRTGSPGRVASTSTPRRHDHQGGSSSSSANAARQPRPANQPCAKALYNYDAKENGDLSFKKGDIVTLRKQIDENWYHGELNGQHGFFPASYVHVIVPLPQIPQCRAMFDFDLKDEKEKDCLSFQKDEVLIVIRRVDDNWVEGKKGDKIGIFPISFVEMNEAARSLINIKPGQGSQQAPQVPQHGGVDGRGGGESHSMPPTSSPLAVPPGAAPPQQKRHSLTLSSQDSPSPPSQHQRRSLELGTSGNLNFPPSSSSSSSSSSNAPPAASSSASAADAIPPQASSLSSSSSSSRDAPPVPVSSRASSDQGRAGGSSSSASGSSRGTSSPPPQPGSLTTPIYTALFHYKPQKEDELELRKGDYYTVGEKCQDGWYKGQCLRTGIRGVFPGNYVQIVRPSSAFKPVNPNVSNVRATVPVPPLPTSHSSSGSSSSSQVTPRLSTCVPAPTSLGSHSNRSTSSVSSGNGNVPPPLLPRVAKNSSGSASGSASKHSGSRSGTGGASKRSSSAHNHSAVGGAHAAHPSGGVQASAHLMSITPSGLASNSHSSSQKWAGAGALHPMSTSSTITPPNAVVGQLGESSQGASHHSSGHSHADRDKERERGRDKDRERREKKKEEREKKSLVKLLYSKSKKSKSPATEADSSTPRGTPPGDAALAAHTRSGSYPSDSSQGAMGDSQHRKTASLDSTPASHPAQPPHSARPSRPKPLARERYRCIVSYPPQTEHEMELTVGDIVYVHKKREDGWFKGTHEKTGKTGMFPGSFVEKAE